MIRKLIKQANQAYTVTLPIGWVRENNLNKSLEVDVSGHDKSLIIKNPSDGVSVKKESVSFDGLEKLAIARQIHALYSRGIDEIRISSREDIGSSLIEILGELIGYALVSQEKNIYVVKEVGGSNYSDLDEIFKRVFQMVLMFYDLAIKDIFGKESEIMGSLNNRDREINKFCLLLQRAINKMSYSDPIRGRILFTYSFALEKIGDEIHRLWRMNIEKKIKKPEKLKDFLLLSKEGLDLTFDFFYTNNFEVADKIHKLKNRVRKDAQVFVKTELNEFARHAIKIIEDAADLNHLTLMSRESQ